MLLVGVPALGGVATVLTNGSDGGGRQNSGGSRSGGRDGDRGGGTKQGGNGVGMMEVCLGWLTAMLCVQTWVLSRVWSESEVLWRRTLAVNPIDHAAMEQKGRGAKTNPI